MVSVADIVPLPVYYSVPILLAGSAEPVIFLHRILYPLSHNDWTRERLRGTEAASVQSLRIEHTPGW